MIENIILYQQHSPEIPVLYHYTTQGGLLGMLTSRKLWLTNIHYLNDSEEYKYSLKLFTDLLEEYHPDFACLLKRDTNFHPVFTLSLSEEGDLLSHWRGYAPNGGYSLAFSIPHLLEIVHSNNLYLGKCQYVKDKSELRHFVRQEIVKMSTEEFRKQYESYEKSGQKKENQFCSQIVDRVYKYLPFIKHHQFREEVEWRITTPYSDALKERCKFRHGKTHLVPYLEYDWSTGKVMIDHMYVSPNPDPELTQNAGEWLLYNLSSGGKVYNSQIPFRNW